MNCSVFLRIFYVLYDSTDLNGKLVISALCFKLWVGSIAAAHTSLSVRSKLDHMCLPCPWFILDSPTDGCLYGLAAHPPLTQTSTHPHAHTHTATSEGQEKGRQGGAVAPHFLRRGGIPPLFCLHTALYMQMSPSSVCCICFNQCLCILYNTGKTYFLGACPPLFFVPITPLNLNCHKVCSIFLFLKVL